MSNLFAPFFYDDDRFLTDVAALDGYTAEELQRVPSEIQRAAVAAANAMDPRYSKIVRDLLRAKDRPSLERRLESLMRELQPLTEFLIPYEPHQERFAHLIPKLRNPLAHAGEPDPFLSAGHRDPLHQAAMWLMRTAVLRDLGIDPGAVAGELGGRIGMAELQRALASVLDKEA